MLQRGNAKALLPTPISSKPGACWMTAFVKLRAEADAWQKARTEFMMRRLNGGRHPDTDLEFWNGYTGDTGSGSAGDVGQGTRLRVDEQPERLAVCWQLQARPPSA